MIRALVGFALNKRLPVGGAGAAIGRARGNHGDAGRSFIRSRRYIHHFLLVSLQAFLGAEVKGFRAAHETVGKFRGNKHATNRIAHRLANAHLGRVTWPLFHNTVPPARLRGAEEPLQDAAQHPCDHDHEDHFHEIGKQASHILSDVPNGLRDARCFLLGRSAPAGALRRVQLLLQTFKRRIRGIQIVQTSPRPPGGGKVVRSFQIHHDQIQ